jgi:hypothetical protein
MMKSSRKSHQSKQTSLEGLQSVALKQQELPLNFTVPLQASTKLEEVGQRHTEFTNSRKGDFSEYYAVTWLWDKGYEVFRNAGCSGPIDLIAYHQETEEIVLIDVKTFFQDKESGIWNRASDGRTKIQKELGVVLLGFDPSTRKLRFIDHRDTE